jgi:uncharacterized protein
MKLKNIELAIDTITKFCQRWQVTEFALFGSILRTDFRPDSDVDVLVTFSPAAQHTLLDLVRMEDELRDIFHREVDLVEKRVVEQSSNWIRQREILSTAEVLYSQNHDLTR